MKAKGLLGAWLFALLAAGWAAAADESFVPLFNGRDLGGWTGAGGHIDDWRVEEGELVLSGRSEGAARLLRTTEKYGSFELHLDFKIFEGGNSGVFIRSEEEGGGLEVQILDDYAEKHAELRDWQYSGSFYGMAGPSRRVSRKPGEWQTMVLRLEGQRLAITLNGTRIVTADLDELAAKEEYERYHEGLKRREGYIALQNYGDLIHFRNIKIRRLD